MINQSLIAEIQGTLNAIIYKLDSNSSEFFVANSKTLKGKLSSSKFESLIKLNEEILNEFEKASNSIYRNDLPSQLQSSFPH